MNNTNETSDSEFWDSVLQVNVDDALSKIAHVQRVLTDSLERFQAMENRPSPIWNLTLEMKEHQEAVAKDKLRILADYVRLLEKPNQSREFKAKLEAISMFLFKWFREESFIKETKNQYPVYDMVDPTDNAIPEEYPPSLEP